MESSITALKNRKPFQQGLFNSRDRVDTDANALLNGSRKTRFRRGRTTNCALVIIAVVLLSVQQLHRSDRFSFSYLEQQRNLEVPNDLRFHTVYLDDSLSHLPSRNGVAPTMKLSKGRWWPNYNGLEFETSSERRISSRDRQRFERFKREELESMNFRRGGYDNSFKDNDDYYEDEENISCRRNSWYHTFYPICNAIHEQMLTETRAFQVTYQGHGYYRDAFVFKNANEAFVWKSYRIERDLDYINMHRVEHEAVIMERLQPSSRIVDIFGHCGSTVFAEHMTKELASDIFLGYQYGESDKEVGYINQEDLDALQEHDVHPMNNMTNEQKLDYAIAMAESIAVIHGFEDGVISHGDLHPVQWLLNSNGQIKLNDFNAADIMTFNSEKEEYCLLDVCITDGSDDLFLAPEEFACEGSNEQRDTYAMGNSIYSLLTGLMPFYQYGRDEVEYVKSLLYDHEEHPYVDPRYRTRSPIESGLVKIMEQCWKWNFEKRKPIFEVVRQLHKLKDSVQGP